MQYFKEFVKNWNNLFYDSFDPRIRDKFLMGSPVTSLSICLVYLIVFQYSLPKWMEKRKKFGVSKVLGVLNVWHCFGSIYFLYKALTLLGWLEAQPWKCAAIDKSMNQIALKVFSTQL